MEIYEILMVVLIPGGITAKLMSITRGKYRVCLLDMTEANCDSAIRWASFTLFTIIATVILWYQMIINTM